MSYPIAVALRGSSTERYDVGWPRARTLEKTPPRVTRGKWESWTFGVSTRDVNTPNLGLNCLHSHAQTSNFRRIYVTLS